MQSMTSARIGMGFNHPLHNVHQMHLKLLQLDLLILGMIRQPVIGWQILKW